MIGRRYEEADVKPGNAEHCGEPAEPRDHFSGERIKGMGCGVFEYVDASY
jgi:hypothetical protein